MSETETLDVIDLIMELFKGRRMCKDSMGNGLPALDLDYCAVRIYVDNDGNVNILPNQRWITLGNIHEKDILDRIKGCV